jgi:capsular exopolysaccharide synthesis family protein
VNDTEQEALDVSGWLAPLEETITQLWSEILLAAPERRRLVFTGTENGVGVTTVAAAAALGLARNLRRRTLLIETNVHSPGLGLHLGAEGPGFAEFCRGEASIPQAIRSTDTPLLHVLTCGSPAAGTGLFAEKGAIDLFDGLSRVYDRIIVDAAPVTAHPDTLLLVRACDASILVARAHRTRSDRVRAAAARLRATGIPLVGTILNQVRRSAPRWFEPSPSAPSRAAFPAP